MQEMHWFFCQRRRRRRQRRESTESSNRFWVDSLVVRLSSVLSPLPMILASMETIRKREKDEDWDCWFLSWQIRVCNGEPKITDLCGCLLMQRYTHSWRTRSLPSLLSSELFSCNLSFLRRNRSQDMSTGGAGSIVVLISQVNDRERERDGV